MTFTVSVNDAALFTPSVVSPEMYASGPFTYMWDFGDSATSSEVSPLHIYTSPGPFTASLTVVNTSTKISGIHHEDIFVSGSVNPGTVINTRLLFNSQAGGSSFYVPSSGDVNRIDKIFDYGNTVNMYPSAGIGTQRAYGLMTDPSVQIDMLVPTKIDGYSMIYADLSFHGINKWELYGSNSTPLADGSNMVVIDQKNVGYLSVNPYTTSITPVTFRYYRFVFHGTNNGNAVSRMYELRLLRNNP